MPRNAFPWGPVRAVLIVLAACGNAAAKTENGNDMCLYLSEAVESGKRADAARMKEETEGVTYYFRYLEILDARGGRENDRPHVDILAREPSSHLRIRFRVDRKVSLAVLMQDPQSETGSAIAVLGRVAAFDEKALLIDLDPVVVRHKDRLVPKVGKELFGELDPTARYYSYTAVPGKPVAVSFADRDLIDNNQNRIPKMEASLAEKQAWADFLLAELAKREKLRAARLLEAKERAGIMRDGANAPALKE